MTVFLFNNSLPVYLWCGHIFHQLLVIASSVHVKCVRWCNCVEVMFLLSRPAPARHECLKGSLSVHERCVLQGALRCCTFMICELPHSRVCDKRTAGAGSRALTAFHDQCVFVQWGQLDETQQLLSAGFSGGYFQCREDNEMRFISKLLGLCCVLVSFSSLSKNSVAHCPHNAHLMFSNTVRMHQHRQIPLFIQSLQNTVIKARLIWTNGLFVSTVFVHVQGAK